MKGTVHRMMNNIGLRHRMIDAHCRKKGNVTVKND